MFTIVREPHDEDILDRIHNIYSGRFMTYFFVLSFIFLCCIAIFCVYALIIIAITNEIDNHGNDECVTLF